MNGAQALVQALKFFEVTRIFALSGNQIMPVFDACLDADIEIIHVRHEAAAVYMAEAYAQVTGRLGIALVTAGAGLGNAVGPLISCMHSESPVVLISGDSPAAQDGFGAFQEMDQVAVTQSQTKFSTRIIKVEALASSLVAAAETSLAARQGPVHLSVPFDVLCADMDDSACAIPARSVSNQSDDRDANNVALVVSAISGAKRPLILTGPSLSSSRVGNLAERVGKHLGTPVIAMESPRGLNDPALGDLARIIADADVIVSLGKRIDFTLGFGTANEQAKWIVVDADKTEGARATRNIEASRLKTIQGDPVAIARKLASGTQHPQSTWFTSVQQGLSARSYVAGEASTTLTSKTLCDAVNLCAGQVESPLIVADGGEFGQWAQAVLTGYPRIINGVAGAIGGGLCYALAAKLAKPEATVFAMMGDGTVGFHMAEFETAARYGIPFVVVIGNDQHWNAEHQIQMRNYGAERLIGCELSGARYDLAVGALGGHGEYVTDVADLETALKRAVNCGMPACINVMIDGMAAPVYN